jgi:hypothetical protein
MSAVASNRDVAESKQARRQQLAAALTSWWLTTQRKAFDTWRESVHEAITTRRVIPQPLCIGFAAAGHISASCL